MDQVRKYIYIYIYGFRIGHLSPINGFSEAGSSFPGVVRLVALAAAFAFRPSGRNVREPRPVPRGIEVDRTAEVNHSEVNTTVPRSEVHGS